jgi:hypothetical protein
MKKIRTALLILVTVFLSVSHVFAELSGGSAGSSPAIETPGNVVIFKWFVFIIVLVGLIRIVLRLRD